MNNIIITHALVFPRVFPGVFPARYSYVSEALKSVCVLSRSHGSWERPRRVKKTIPVLINWFVRCFGEKATCSEIAASTTEDVSSTLA